MKRPWLLLLCWPLVALAGCINVNAHIVVDVNVKMQKALDDVFGDLDRKDPSMNPVAKP